MTLNLFQWLVATAALMALAWHERPGPWPLLRIAGGLLCLAPFALVSLARYQLGRAFSLTAQARTLVTDGLYTRNPIYIFAKLFLVGLTLVLQSWWPIAILVAAIPLQTLRTRKESAVRGRLRRPVPPIQSPHLVLNRLPNACTSALKR